MMEVVPTSESSLAAIAITKFLWLGSKVHGLCVKPKLGRAAWPTTSAKAYRLTLRQDLVKVGFSVYGSVATLLSYKLI